jgi:glyoxalase family protein
MDPLNGIHHVTAICGDPQRNLDFYAGLLGLRLVKKTVNFDDPNSYHLYYGDRSGAPGTLLTFFAWPGAPRGKAGDGEPGALTLSVPVGSLDWWGRHLTAFGVTTQSKHVFEENVLAFSDPDDMEVHLVESSRSSQTDPWHSPGIPQTHAISGIHSVTLALRNLGTSTALYTRDLGFQAAGEKDGTHRFYVAKSIVDVEVSSGARGHMGTGSIHHVAFRTEDDASQLAWLANLTSLGLHVSPVMDRKYFHSIYFREPGGVLFEIATDGPGMLVDESEQQLGDHLALPAEYESMRPQLERTLIPLHSPVVAA